MELGLICRAVRMSPYLRIASALGRDSRSLFQLPQRTSQRFYSATKDDAPSNLGDSDSGNKAMASTTKRALDDNATVRLSSLTDHRVDRLERYILVWGGKFKSVDEVPNYVTQDTMERARNKARIKINLMMVAATVFGCFLMIWSGKKAQREGITVSKINEEWHRKIKEESKGQ